MGSLSQLLRWRKEITIKDADGKDLLIDGKPRKVYIRVIGDRDIQEAYRLARIASNNKRKALRDVDSLEYQDEVLTFADASEEECKALIMAARGTNWTAEAYSAVVRPNEVMLKEVAIDPDAPTLEEQEQMDIDNHKLELEYQQQIEEFIKTKETEAQTEIDVLDLESLRVLAQVEASVILPMTVFLRELNEEKCWRACYDDKDYTKRSFDGINDFRDALPFIKDQLLLEYSALEIGADEIKN
jgi:hypothetical protein